MTKDFKGERTGQIFAADVIVAVVASEAGRQLVVGPGLFVDDVTPTPLLPRRLRVGGRERRRLRRRGNFALFAQSFCKAR